MEELKEYADKNIPIECYMLHGRSMGSIYIKDDMTFVHLYLNNYLQYYEIDGYLLNQKEINYIHKNICKNCLYSEYNYDLDCRYIKDREGCKNYFITPESMFMYYVKRIYNALFKK